MGFKWSNLAARGENVPRWAGVFVLAIGGLVLLGWQFNLEMVKRLLPGMPAMNPLTAVCFIVSGASLWLSQPKFQSSPAKKRTAKFCAFFVFSVATSVLINEFSNWRFEIDHLIFASRLAFDASPAGGMFPSHMAATTCFAFIACSLVVFFLDVEIGSRKRRPAQFFLAAVVFVSWLSLISYSYSTRTFYIAAIFRTMALHTAMTFLVLSVGLAFLRPNCGLMANFTSAGAGGMMARRLLPAAILIPTALGLLRLAGQQTGFFTNDFGGAVLVASNIFVFTVIIWWNASALNQWENETNRAAKILRDSEKRFRSTWERCADGMRLTDEHGIIIEVNQAFCKLVGLHREELVGNSIAVMYHEDENPAMHVRNYQRQFQTGKASTNLERHIKFPSGRSKDIEFTNSFVQGENESPLLLAIFRDITERKQAENEIRLLNTNLEQRVAERTTELQHSEQRYRFLSDSLPQILWTARPDGYLDYYNERWFDYTGITVDVSNARSWEPVVHPEDFPDFIARWEESIKSGNEYEFEYRLRRASDGAYRWHLRRAFPLRNERGELVQWVGTCTDIDDLKRADAQIRELNTDLEQRVFERTEALAAINKRLQYDIAERKRVEKALRESESRFRSLSASSPIGIFQTDAEGRGLYTNEQWQKIADLSLEESLGEGWLNVIHPDDRDAVMTNWARCSLEQTDFSQEFRFLTKNGLVRWVHTRAALIQSHSGEAGGFVGTTEDITDRKMAEERFRILFEYSSDAHILFDDTGIIDCNHATVSLLRCKNKSDLLTRHPAELSPEFQPDGTRSDEKSFEMDTAARCNGYHRFEWVNRKMDGEEFPVEITLTPVTLNNRPTLLAVWHDLTERKEAEAKVQQFNAQLEANNHELKKALANVKTLSGLLPICSGCKKIRDDSGYWNQIEFFIRDHSEANFSHGLCPECTKHYFPGIAKAAS